LKFLEQLGDSSYVTRPSAGLLVYPYEDAGASASYALKMLEELDPIGVAQRKDDADGNNPIDHGYLLGTRYVPWFKP
jgi:hypothetical protein